MNNCSNLITFTLCLIILLVAIDMVQAGVEPSPFKQMENMINTILNRMKSVEHRLEMVSIKLNDTGSRNYIGMINQIKNLEYTAIAVYGRMCKLMTIWRNVGSVPYGSDLYLDMKEARSIAGQWIATADYIERCLEYPPPEFESLLESIRIHAQSIIDMIDTMLEE